jgi:hypothetical protein
MSTNNTKNITVMLGVATIASLTALTSPANASTSIENLLSQAKLSFDAPTQQVEKFGAIASLEKLDSSTQAAKKDSNCGCGGGNCSCKPK